VLITFFIDVGVIIDRQQAMEMRDIDYYEVRARDVKSADITSCEGNAEILQQLRDQDTSLEVLNISDHAFVIGEGDDLGWLGYFIGKSKYLEQLRIRSWGEGENIEAFMEEINHNRSINSLYIGTNLGGVSFRNLCPFFRNNNNRLTQLELDHFEVGLECAQSIAFVLGESQYYSLTTLRLEGCNLSDEGFAGIATALRTHPQLESLYLEGNNIGLMGCIALADMLRGWGTSNLKTLDLDGNGIDDQGLQALAAGMTNTKLEALYLSDNLITGVGLRSFSTYFQSESCCLNTLFLYRVNFGDEGAVALAEGLMGNKSLKCLDFDPDESGITGVGWAAFSKVLCDPTSINNTYHSNHSIVMIGDNLDSTPLDIREYLDLNECPHPAIYKMLESHSDLDMNPFFQWKLKLLPVVINWFRSASSGMMHVNYPQEESTQRQNLQSRELSALYKFVRGMPALTVVAYWQQQVINIQARRRRLDVEEETAWVRLGGRPRDEGNVEFIQIGTKRMRQE